ncbi:MAG: hypothetical protein RR330_00555 [Alistipes sp.]
MYKMLLSISNDVILKGLSAGIMYLLLILFLAYEVTIIQLISALLAGALALVLVIRWGLLWCGRIEPKLHAIWPEKGVNLLFPACTSVYALIFYLRGDMLVGTIAAVLSILSAVAVCILLFQAKRHSF